VSIVRRPSALPLFQGIFRVAVSPNRRGVPAVTHAAETVLFRPATPNPLRALLVKGEVTIEEEPTARSRAEAGRLRRSGDPVPAVRFDLRPVSPPRRARALTGLSAHHDRHRATKVSSSRSTSATSAASSTRTAT